MRLLTGEHAAQKNTPKNLPIRNNPSHTLLPGGEVSPGGQKKACLPGPVLGRLTVSRGTYVLFGDELGVAAM